MLKAQPAPVPQAVETDPASQLVEPPRIEHPAERSRTVDCKATADDAGLDLREEVERLKGLLKECGRSNRAHNTLSEPMEQQNVELTRIDRCDSCRKLAAKPLYLRAVDLSQRHKTSEALQLFRRVLHIDPTHRQVA